MEAVVLLLLGLILPAVPHLASGIPVQPHFDYKKLAGLWHRLAMVAKGEDQFIIGPEIQISPMRKGDLSVGMNFIVRLACRFIDFRYRNAGQPGVFNVYHANGDLSTIHVVDTDYNGHLVLHTETAGNSALSLFVRGSDAPESLKKMFEDYVRSLGFSKTDIKYQSQDEQCPLSRPRPKKNQR
ncbi:epididymal secretory protein 4-like [Sceloporus undulatus]|uniref:epididymal secretory protein 4-like n=1 Tax=Sceloporus undulatus TaxID=8520 RepID=UPI001C4ACC50|nr:epididymal secretory protein 4-like [Sceloporus undulatus]